MAHFENHPLQGAFVSHCLNALSDLIADQGQEMLCAADITVPSRAVSIVLIVSERGEISAADIAQALDQPHQLVTQRVDLLVKLGMLERAIDPQDKRRKTLLLTPIGETQTARLVKRLEQASSAFAALFAEIECDLVEMSNKAAEALERTPLLARIDALAAQSIQQRDADPMGVDQ